MKPTQSQSSTPKHLLNEKLDILNDDALSHHCEMLAQSLNASDYDRTHKKLDSLLQKKALLHSMEELLVKAQKAGNHSLAARLEDTIQEVIKLGDFESFNDFVRTPIGQQLIEQNYKTEWRSPCPLCNAKPSSINDGFIVPNGLRMHLEGGNKTRQCIVRKAIDDSYHEKTGERPWNHWRY